MRVGLVVYGSLDTLSGGYLYDRQLVAALERAGDTVEVLSLPWRSYGRHLSDNFDRAWQQRLAAARVDVLLQDELNHPSLFWLNRRLRAKVSQPFVGIVHHLRSSEAWPSWQNWLYARVERRYLATVNGFVCNSEASRAAVERLIGPGRPVVVAPPAGNRWQAVPPEGEIVARAKEPGPLRVLFLGNLIPRKGLHTLLAALERLPEGSVMLDVIGNPGVDPGYARRMQALARKPALGPAVTFRGLQTDARVAGFLARSHVLAVPSSFEGFGIVYLEGMAFGLPAMATTAGGAGEFVRDGENGFLVTPGDVQTLADRLLRLQSDRALLAALGLAARRTYDQQPTWEQTGAKIRTFLEQGVLARQAAVPA